MSWIKPGKSMWDWRVWDYKTKDGFTYRLNTTSHLRFIDFASQNNIDYFLMDADWYGAEFSENSDPSSANGLINPHYSSGVKSSIKASVFQTLYFVGDKSCVFIEVITNNSCCDGISI